MIKLLGEKVNHKTFGIGMITAFDGCYITVQFANEAKRFLYPTAFEKFLIPLNDNLNEQIKSDILGNKRIDINKGNTFGTAYAPKKQLDDKSIKYAEEIKTNIAFKCNYCNGGESDAQIGFDGICSDDLINYNIKVGHKSWCSQAQCVCRQYFDGHISRKELDVLGEKGEFVCYESRMLRDWFAKAGMHTQGKKKGESMKLRKVRKNSLAVLTTREPGLKEEERMIFALFLIDDFFEGDSENEGYVRTNSEYKVQFSEEEAKQLLFWNYYINNGDSPRPRWSSGLHRYLSDIEAVQILRDAVKIKEGTSCETITKELLNYFCEINRIDLSLVDKPKGALKI